MAECQYGHDREKTSSSSAGAVGEDHEALLKKRF